MAGLTKDQVSKLKKGDELRWRCQGLIAADTGEVLMPYGWCVVKFDSVRNVQGDTVVIVEYKPDEYVNSYFGNLKLLEVDELFERWTG